MQPYSNKKIGVMLAGSGVFDGSEIHEAIITLLALDKAKAQMICMAPNIEQTHVINHANRKETVSEKRNVFVESARIARGNIREATSISANELDALIFPGGFGAAKNLSDYAFEGKNLTVIPVVEKLITEMHANNKPLGFICIAPVIAAKVFGKYHPQITIGNDPQTASDIESLGAKHVKCNVDDIIVDEKNKIVTTPAYMLGPSISNVALGIEKCVNKVLELTK